jgi:hypothetical protein
MSLISLISLNLWWDCDAEYEELFFMWEQNHVKEVDMFQSTVSK